MSARHRNPGLDLAAAIILLTRIPLPWARLSKEPPDLNASVWAFPVVGMIVGGGAAIVFALALGLGLPSTVAAILAIVAMVLMSGAMHEDGLADVADGFGGGHDLERKLDIMRDSHIGAYGTIAIVLSMALRIAGLTALNATEAALALVIAGMMSRLVMTYIMRYLPSMRQDGLAHDTGRPSSMRIMSGSALALFAAIVLVGPEIAVFAMAVAFVACLIMGWIAKSQIGGFTGDVLGATQQVSEIAVLLFLAAWWNPA